MNLEYYLEEDKRLWKVNMLARTLYNIADLEVHNYEHAFWDTDKIIKIGESEGHRDISIPIAAALMHDAGVARGPYNDHTINGGKIVRDYLPRIGFNQDDTEEIAIAVEQHNSMEHYSDTSKFLYDADTLNKSGQHGLNQCIAVGREFGLDLSGMASRFKKYLNSIADKGFYTATAKNIDIEMGNGVPGVKLVAEFWKRTDELLKLGNLNDNEIINKLEKELNIQYER